MNPEPLKDKLISFDEKKYVRLAWKHFFHKDDIKSAVEWLHNELEKLDSEYASTEMTDVGYSMSVRVRGLVNKAFEDVIKNEKRN